MSEVRSILLSGVSARASLALGLSTPVANQNLAQDQCLCVAANLEVTRRSSMRILPQLGSKLRNPRRDGLR
jgi:hypothetical protein